MKRLAAILLAALCSVVLVSCGDDDETSTSDTTAATDDTSDTTAADGSTTTAASGEVPAGVTVVSVSDDLAAKPEIELEPADEAPGEVVIEDTVEGDGATVEEGATVEVQYVGLLTDGTQFDASWDNGGVPISFGLDQVIEGWGTGLVGMKEGGRRVLVIPPELAYGDTPPGGDIPPGATLVFVVDLVSVTNPAPKGVTVTDVSDDLDAEPTFELEPAAEAPTEIVTTDVVEGDGAEVTGADDTVEVQYVGVLTDGTEFDSSWARGESATFPLSNVIPGWSEGLVGMKEGGRRVLVVPSDKGYGPTGTPDGSIPPDSTLVFIVDLLSVGAGDTTTTAAGE